MDIRITSVAVVVLVGVMAAAPVGAQTASYTDQLGSDFRYLVNNVVADGRDIVTSPLHAGEVLRNPDFYYTLIGAGALLGTGFLLDNTVRSRLRNMSSNTATTLENGGTYAAAGGAGLIYLWGLYSDNDRARQYMLTGGESAGLASLVALGLKYGFGRKRPNQGGGHWAFFDHGESFVSGEATPVFAVPAAISEYADNRWWVATPAYSKAVTVGIGRMGHDEHWLSDVIGAGLVGVATTELLLYLHKEHAEDHSKWQIFGVGAPSGSGGGIGAGYQW